MLLRDLFHSPPLHEDFINKAFIDEPDFSPRWSKIVGTIDGRDVWGSRCWGEHLDVYAFRDDESLEAFIVIDTSVTPHALVRISSNIKGKGLVTTLLGFVTKKLGNHLIIAKSEMMSADGQEWLKKLILNPHGFEIHDGHGNKILPSQIDDELKKAKSSKQPGDLEIFIENQRSLPLWGTGYRIMNEMSQTLTSEDIE
jgi:hypothetical protein